MKCKNCGHDEDRHAHSTNSCPAYENTRTVADWLGGLWADTTFEPYNEVADKLLTRIAELILKIAELILKIAELEKRIVHLEDDLMAREYHKELKQSMADRLKDKSY